MFSACRHFLILPNPTGMCSRGGERTRESKGENNEEIMNGALELRVLSDEVVQVLLLPFLDS